MAENSKQFTYEPITENGAVVGVVLTVLFDVIPQKSQSGKTILDYTTHGKKELVFEDIDRIINLNIYHRP